MTRAKSAALHLDELSMPSKALQSKKSVTNSNLQAGQRKRAALGDVSNVGKGEAAEGKKATLKPGLVSKAAQPTGVQKTRTTTSRTALATKESKKNADVKRAGSGSGAIGVQKRKVSTASAVENSGVENREPSRKKVHTMESEKRVQTERAESQASNVVEPVVKAAEPKSIYPKNVKDLDSEDLDDPLMVAEYAHEIFEYLRDLECGTIPNPNYMDHQDDLEWKTRGILVDWLIEVHTRFHLLPETLFLAINIIDRFLSEKVVQLDRLQLVGITAMFIASKYEEVLSPHVANFRHVADDGFTEAEILSAERFILSTLNYDLSYPNPMNFLRRISKADNYDIQSRTVGKYLMEISLLDHRFMAFRPSHVAAAAMYLSRLILDRGDWDETLSFYAGYTEVEIEPVVNLMVDYLARPIVHDAFFKKYASKKFLKGKLYVLACCILQHQIC
jgi:G2/mitotic-specific cyclin 1/2